MFSQLFQTFANCFKIPELRSRIIFTALVLGVCRLIAMTPIPGLDGVALSAFFESQSKNAGTNSVVGLYSLFTGGALEKCAVGSLGIMPYISATIIIQLLSAVIPVLSKLSREEGGRAKIIAYGRYLTVLLCLGQGLFMTLGWEHPEKAFSGFSGSLIPPDTNLWVYRIQTVAILTTATVLLMWLGEQITERGLGNGISILIFGGIAAGLPNAIGGLLELVRTGAMSIIVALFIVVLVALVTFVVVFIERGQRKILVNYARRQVGNKVYGGQSSHLPLKLNMAGVIPPIFASSIILLPATVVGWLSTGDSMRWLKDIAGSLTPGQPIYVMFYASAIVFFCFFYTALVFNSRETADNLKKSGAFIPGIRPGEQTARYIDKILLRLTFAGAIYITLVCLLPEFLILKYNVPFYFGGTSLLIIVVVTMDFMAQVQNYLMSQQYESLLKKANFKSS